MGIEVFKKHLREKRAVKIIAGIDNFDLENVAKVCRAAQNGHASAVDIAAKKEVYDIARKNTKLLVLVLYYFYFLFICFTFVCFLRTFYIFIFSFYVYISIFYIYNRSVIYNYLWG